MRYKFYREHKYVSFMLNELERLTAKTDFRVPSQTEKVVQEFNSLAAMLEGHAEYENSALHELLKKKNSSVHAEIEDDHKHQDEQLADLRNKLNAILESADEKEQVELGYQFYLAYRKFVGDNLVHLHEEETIILPELQRLYSDEELKAVEAHTYGIMTPEQMVSMMDHLFPQMNPNDREAFLTDIKDSEPEKFVAAWNITKLKLEPEERESLEKKLR